MLMLIAIVAVAMWAYRAYERRNSSYSRTYMLGGVSHWMHPGEKNIELRIYQIHNAGGRESEKLKVEAISNNTNSDAPISSGVTIASTLLKETVPAGGSIYDVKTFLKIDAFPTFGVPQNIQFILLEKDRGSDTFHKVSSFQLETEYVFQEATWLKWWERISGFQWTGIGICFSAIVISLAYGIREIRAPKQFTRLHPSLSEKEGGLNEKEDQNAIVEAQQLPPDAAVLSMRALHGVLMAAASERPRIKQVQVVDRLRPYVLEIAKQDLVGPRPELDHSVSHLRSQLVACYVEAYLRSGKEYQENTLNNWLVLLNAVRKSCSCQSDFLGARGMVYKKLGRKMFARRDFSRLGKIKHRAKRLAWRNLKTLPITSDGTHLPFSIEWTKRKSEPPVELEMLPDVNPIAARVSYDNSWGSAFIIGQDEKSWYALTTQHGLPSVNLAIELLGDKATHAASFQASPIARSAEAVWIYPDLDILVVRCEKRAEDTFVKTAVFGVAQNLKDSAFPPIYTSASYFIDMDAEVLRNCDIRHGFLVDDNLKLDAKNIGDPGDGFSFDIQYVMRMRAENLKAGCCGGAVQRIHDGAVVGMITGAHQHDGTILFFPSELLVRALKKVQKRS